jgi:hypothetical protein
MRIDKWNRSIRREHVPVPLCPPQIPHDLTWARTRAAAVGSRRLTAWAMVRPPPLISEIKSSTFIGELMWTNSRFVPHRKHSLPHVCFYINSPNSVVSVYRGWTTEIRFPARAKDFSVLHSVQTALGTTHPPVQWVPGALSSGVK